MFHRLRAIVSLSFSCQCRQPTGTRQEYVLVKETNAEGKETMFCKLEIPSQRDSSKDYGSCSECETDTDFCAS